MRRPASLWTGETGAAHSTSTWSERSAGGSPLTNRSTASRTKAEGSMSCSSADESRTAAIR